MKMGWIKPKPPRDADQEAADMFYSLWQQDDQSDFTRRYRDHIPAPKMALPTHSESYNPPPEYLLTEEEVLLNMCHIVVGWLKEGSLLPGLGFGEGSTEMCRIRNIC